MKLCVLGSPISHSLSPVIHKIFAEGTGINAEYEKIKTEPAELASTVKRLIKEGYSGFNCTMPLKTEIVNLLDEKTEEVEILQSCNTVKIIGGRRCGYTTDGFGIAESIKQHVKNLDGLNILVLGAGGTTRSALYSLASENVKTITILNRSEEGLKNLKNIFSYEKKSEFIYDFLNKENLYKYVKKADIFINTTNLGMTGFEEHKDFTFLEELKKDSIVFDSVYNPLKTKLLQESEKLNLRTINGLSILVYQGAKAFEIWTNQKIPQEHIKKSYAAIYGG